MHRIFQTSGLSALGLILMGTLHLSACGDDDSATPTDEPDAGGGDVTPDAGGGDVMPDAGGGDVDPEVDAGPEEMDGGAMDDAGPGETDGGDAGPAAAQIEQLTETVVAGATDLRGLTYAKNGKIYASGYSDVDPADRQLVIVRFNADGSLDTDFGDDGVLLHNVIDGEEQSLAIVELDNGDIIVQANVVDGQGGQLVADSAAGDAGAGGMRPDGKNVVLLRFDDEGELVTSFGTNGMQVVDFGWTDADNASWPVPGYDSSKEAGSQWTGAGYPEDTAWDIQLDPSAPAGAETLVVFGYGPAMRATGGGTQRYDNDRYVVRVLAADGSNDPSFNGDGTPFTYGSPGGLRDNARRGIVEADGSIVSSGYANFGENLGNHVMLIRLEKDGTPDTDFGFDIADPGVAKFNPFVDDGGMAEAYAVARQSDGRYVTTGYGNATGEGVESTYGYATTEDRDLVAFGLTPTGLDLSYGISGTRAIQSEEYALGDAQDRGRHLAMLPDDRSVHVGRFGPNAAIFVVTKDGSLDESVGTDGRFDYPTFAGSQFFNVAVSSDGTRIAATTTAHADGPGLVLLSVSEE